MAIHLTEEGGGHVVTCDCGGHLSWWPTRAAAEKARDTHAAKHKPKDGG